MQYDNRMYFTTKKGLKNHFKFLAKHGHPDYFKEVFETNEHLTKFFSEKELMDIGMLEYSAREKQNKILRK